MLLAMFVQPAIHAADGPRGLRTFWRKIIGEGLNDD
jgi:hypothetical protein